MTIHRRRCAPHSHGSAVPFVVDSNAREDAAERLHQCDDARRLSMAGRSLMVMWYRRYAPHNHGSTMYCRADLITRRCIRTGAPRFTLRRDWTHYPIVLCHEIHIYVIPTICAAKSCEYHVPRLRPQDMRIRPRYSIRGVPCDARRWPHDARMQPDQGMHRTMLVVMMIRADIGVPTYFR